MNRGVIEKNSSDSALLIKILESSRGGSALIYWGYVKLDMRLPINLPKAELGRFALSIEENYYILCWLRRSFDTFTCTAVTRALF